jgi:hypothetical protein
VARNSCPVEQRCIRTDRSDRQGILESIAAGITRYHKLLQHRSVRQFDASVTCEIDGGIRREIIDEGHQPRRIKTWMAGCRAICRVPFQPLRPAIGKPQRDKIADVPAPKSSLQSCNRMSRSSNLAIRRFHT